MDGTESHHHAQGHPACQSKNNLLTHVEYIDETCARYELGPLASDPPGKLDVLGHDGDSLGMDGTEVGVVEQSHEVSLAGLLESSHSGRLEPQVGLKILSNFTHQSLEGKLPDQQFGRLLVTSNFPQSNRARPVSVGLLDATSAGSTLPGSLGG